MKLIGIDVSSFAIAGSLVIFFLALEMILGIRLYRDEVPETASIVPIAFPLIAGTGTMTTLISLQSQYSTQTILIGIFVNMVIVYLVFAIGGTVRAIIGQSRYQYHSKSIWDCTHGHLHKIIQNQCWFLISCSSSLLQHMTRLIHSFRFALKGIRIYLLSGGNVPLHMLATVMVIFAGWWLDVSFIQWCLLVLAMTMVHVAEAFNTAIKNW